MSTPTSAYNPSTAQQSGCDLLVEFAGTSIICMLAGNTDGWAPVGFRRHFSLAGWDRCDSTA